MKTKNYSFYYLLKIVETLKNHHEWISSLDQLFLFITGLSLSIPSLNDGQQNRS